MKSKILKIIEEHRSLIDTIHNDNKLMEQIEGLVKICSQSLLAGNKILFCGNGGSASDAQHIAAELSGKFKMNRAPLYAEALHVNTSYLTAVANDYGFEYAYSRLVEAKGKKGDILFGLSTSGNSQNVVKALQKAQEQKLTTVGFAGKQGGEMIKFCDNSILIESNNTPRIQEAHLLIGHILCELIEESLFIKKEE